MAEHKERPWIYDMDRAPHIYPIEGLYDDGTHEEIRWEKNRCCILGSRAGAMGAGWQSCAVELPVGGGPEIVAWREVQASKYPSHNQTSTGDVS